MLAPTASRRGANFVPDVLDTGIYDQIIPVTNEDAYDMGREMGKVEGLLVGISAGRLCGRPLNWQARRTRARPSWHCCRDTGDRVSALRLCSRCDRTRKGSVGMVPTERFYALFKICWISSKVSTKWTPACRSFVETPISTMCRSSLMR